MGHIRFLYFSYLYHSEGCKNSTYFRSANNPTLFYFFMKQPGIINLPKITDPRGNLTYMEYSKILPFEINRVFWTYDVPGGEIRGGHAFHTQEELIIALSGSFDVIITDKYGATTKFQMNRSYYGLYLPPKTWRHIENFSTNSLSLHLSSHQYQPEDYIRDFDELQKSLNETV